jgi:hypothetical protein
MTFMRIKLGSVEAYMAGAAARAAELGATSRTARVTLYDHPALTNSVLTALESGSRTPTDEERVALLETGQRLGWSTPDGDLQALPSTTP